MSSGQQPQNPLLLLGQYSDDELDEESNKEHNHATVESSSPKDEVINGLFSTFVHSGCEGSTVWFFPLVKGNPFSMLALNITAY